MSPVDIFLVSSTNNQALSLFVIKFYFNKYAQLYRVCSNTSSDEMSEKPGPVKRYGRLQALGKECANSVCGQGIAIADRAYRQEDNGNSEDLGAEGGALYAAPLFK